MQITFFTKNLDLWFKAFYKNMDSRFKSKNMTCDRIRSPSLLASSHFSFSIGASSLLSTTSTSLKVMICMNYFSFKRFVIWKSQKIRITDPFSMKKFQFVIQITFFPQGLRFLIRINFVRIFRFVIRLIFLWICAHC